MNQFSYIFLFIFLILNSFIFIKANKKYLLSNFKIQSKTLNDSEVSFCFFNNNENCLKSIEFDINSNSIIFNATDQSYSINFDVNDKTKIYVKINLRLNGSDFESKSSMTTLINVDTKSIVFNKLVEQFSVELNFLVTCQNGYVSPTCTEIDLCKKIYGICKNGGTCNQEKGTVKCICSPEYKGDTCEFLYNACQNHSCMHDSTCHSDPFKELKYRCECKEGYMGTSCNEQKDPCIENVCNNNSSCIRDDESKLKYKCLCKKEFTGRFCDLNYDYCAQNQTLCSHFINATCLNTKASAVCYCEGGCNTASSSKNIPDQLTLPFVWPFSELITFIFVLLEGIFIVILIVVIILMKTACCHSNNNQHKSYLEDNLLLNTSNKTDKECLEFGSNYNRQPIVIEDIDNRRSINPLYDISDLQTFTNNHVNNDTPGLSTFGRR